VCWRSFLCVLAEQANTAHAAAQKLLRERKQKGWRTVPQQGEVCDEVTTQL
jgi:predicted DNA-binding WGR domain protein